MVLKGRMGEGHKHNLRLRWWDNWLKQYDINGWTFLVLNKSIINMKGVSFYKDRWNEDDYFDSF